MYAYIDLSVFLHGVIDRPRDFIGRTPEQTDSILKAQLAWLLSCDWLKGYTDEPVFPILLRDQKNGLKGYWRHEYLQRPAVWQAIPRFTPKTKKPKKPEPVVYKGNRTAKTAAEKAKARHFREKSNWYESELARYGVPQLRATGYEADDWLGAIARVMLDQHPDIRQNAAIVTVDSDHMGCVSEKLAWYCMTGYPPRVRHTMPAINEWAQRRLKVTLDKPRDIWAVKAEQGDRSDNLPPGSPIEVIDLLAPPKDFDLYLQPGGRDACLNALKACWRAPKQDGRRANEYLKSVGVRPYPRPFDASTDVYHGLQAA